ncbi:hypothetical protein ACFL0H_07695 [Thermodesulfobacteriota bacterium]
MRWMEYITIWSGERVQHEKVVGLLVQLEKLPSDEGLKKIRIFRHHRLDNEWGVQIEWESDKVAIKKSTLGLHLAQSFNNFGLISHFVWTEEKVFDLKAKSKASEQKT